MHISGASGNEPSVHTLTRFGKYHLIASLGQGGMAKVYLALLAGPADFQKLLVVKIMREDALSGSEEGARMFWAEARLSARLLHPNIVHTHEVGEQSGRCFLAMEYLDGQPLSAILNRARADREVPLAELVRVLSEIARGLHYAHQLRGFQGEELHVVHRDVSPQNVIVTYDGHGKLVDFGIAKTTDGEQTQLGLVKGKLDYIAPEQLRGEAVDARADVFALGAILWEVVSGQRFAGGRKVSDVQKMQTRLSGGERKLRDVKPDAPVELMRIVKAAIALDPADRFPDAATFADALDAYLERENLRPNARILAHCLGPLFEQERAEMRALIDRQIQLVKSERSRDSQELPVETSSTDTRKLREGFGLYVADSHTAERSSVRSAAILRSARASTVAPAGSDRSLLWKGSTLVVAAALGLLFLHSRTEDDSSRAQREQRDRESATAASSAREAASRLDMLPDSQAPQSARPSALAALPESALSTVTIQLQVTPPEATVLLDGVRVAVPFSGSFRKDAALHHVDVSASGYQPTKEFVAFDRDITLQIELKPAHVGRRGVQLDRLIERAAQTVEGHPEQTPRPSVILVPRVEPAEPAGRDQVLERPNPYSSE